MRSLVIEHDSFSTPERVGAHLERRGVTLDPFVVVPDIQNPEVTATFPAPGRHDLVVLMGSPWSAYDPRVRGWVDPEVDVVRTHLAQGRPILGICFGAQLMSAALGGTVSKSERPEYGWGTIESEEPSLASGPWFQYHGDEFTLPEGAVRIAYNDSGVQAFRFGNSLAVQFHPEVTGPLISSWCEVGGDANLIDAGLDPAQLIEETEVLARTTQPALERMLDWWLDDLVGGFE